MNKVISNLIIAILVIASFSQIKAVVEAPTSIYISKSSEANKIVLNLENMFADNVKCTFTNEEGIIIFRDQISTENRVSKKYDLGQLPMGKYTIEVNDLMKVERLELVISKEGIEFSNEIAEITYKPTVWLNEDKTVDFNLLALGQVASISISSLEGEIFTESFKKQSSISKRFNLNGLESGEYTVRVSINGKTFTHTLAL